MSVNARALLTDYLQYQRDIGVDSIVFEHGSAIKTLLTGADWTVNKNYGGYSRPSSSASAMSTTMASTAPVSKGSTGGGEAPASPFAKLANLRPVDTLDLRKLERPAPRPPAPVNSAKREKLAVLYREALNCEKCALSKTRGKVIFGSGSADGRVFIVGGAPDSCDEASGLPFQGAIGELFDKILSKLGLDRKKDIFATYAQKCRQCVIPKNSPQAVESQPQHQHLQQETLFAAKPDNQGIGSLENRFEQQYAAVCRTLLDRQIEIIEPKVILIFGHLPANFILENDSDMEQLRTMNHIYKGVPVVATYSLSLMLRETQYRSGAWEDIKKAMNYAS